MVESAKREFKIAAQIAHSVYHILDDHAEEHAQTGNVTVRIPAREWKELNRVIDLLGTDPHEVLHDLIGVNDPAPPKEPNTSMEATTVGLEPSHDKRQPEAADLASGRTSALSAPHNVTNE